MGFLSPKPAVSSSSNQNNALLTKDYSGQISNGTHANDFLSSLLTGTGNVGAANAGYKNYLQMAGFAPAMTQLSQDITGQGAASGLLNSGSTTKALQSAGANLNNQFFNNYLQNLGAQSTQGLQAGSILGNAGQTSSSNGGGPSTFSNIMSAVSGIASIFSDRRLKQDIGLVRTDPDGLNWYNFSYKRDPAKQIHVGVMADEVAKIRPHALGPVISGFATVNYGAL